MGVQMANGYWIERLIHSLAGSGSDVKKGELKALRDRIQGTETASGVVFRGEEEEHENLKGSSRRKVRDDQAPARGPSLSIYVPSLSSATRLRKAPTSLRRV